MQDKAKAEQKGMSIQQLKSRWNNMAPMYSNFDSCMQTFYYTLVNMLRIPSAKHILEIACGICKLIPYTMSIKPVQCTYLATDLSENMVKMGVNYIDGYIKKLGVTIGVQEWMSRNNLSLAAHNGEEVIQSPHKFDRIICNLVLMVTQDPYKMLRSLHKVASQDCLLGVTIWGDKKLSNFLTLPDYAKTELGRPLPKGRQNFHLFNKLQQIGNETGWEVIVQWQQNAPFPNIQLNHGLIKLIAGFSTFDEKISEIVQNKVNETFKQKKVLNFPAQIAILRKK